LSHAELDLASESFPLSATSTTAILFGALSLWLLWPLLLPAVGLQQWRATGSTGAFLMPRTQRRKSLACAGI
jgi:hypothetical protein